jgi:hypothetical protein
MVVLAAGFLAFLGGIEALYKESFTSRSCGRAVDDHRHGLTGARHH